MNARRACVDDGGGGRVRHARGREDEHRRHYGRAPARDPIFHCSSLCRATEKLTGFFGCLANLLRPVHGTPRHGTPQGRGAHDFTSEQFRREIAHPAPHGGRVAGSRSAQGGGGCGRGRRPRRPALGAWRPTVVRRGYGRSARVRPRQARPSRVASRDFTSESFHRVDMRRVGAGRPTVARRGYGRSARVRPRQARPSRVASRDFTSESFHRVDMRRVGAGRPTVARRGYGRSARVRPRQARPSRVASRDFTSESFHRVDMRRVGARSTRATLGAGRPTVARHGCGRSARVRPRQSRPSRVAPRDFTSESFRRNLFYTSTRSSLNL